MGVTKPQAEEILKTVQVEASLYGLELNLDRTELLAHPQDPEGFVQFVDDTTVTEVNQSKYLGFPLKNIKEGTLDIIGSN